MNRQLLEKEVLDDTGKKLETEERYAALACVDATRIPTEKRQLEEEIEDLQTEQIVLGVSYGDRAMISRRQKIITQTILKLQQCLHRIEQIELDTLNVNEIAEFSQACFYRAASESFISATQKLSDADIDDPLMVISEALDQTGDKIWAGQMTTILQEYAESFHRSLSTILPDIEEVRMECQMILSYAKQEVDEVLKNY